MVVTFQKIDTVALINIGSPPVNSLGIAVRQGLSSALARAFDDGDVASVVISGGDRIFSAGADISEFGLFPTAPLLPDVVNMIEASAKPVVAAIRGMCLGGGLEIALACHWRLAAPSARLGLPETKLGLMPGAGGTQRLPRLVGIEAALTAILSGEPMSAEGAYRIGLVDQLASNDDLEDKAISFARTATVRRTGDMAITADPALIHQAAADHSRRSMSSAVFEAVIAAVRAATEQPIAEGLKIEHALFRALLEGAESKALRYIFAAERKAAKIDGLAEHTARRPIASVGIVGAGTMGGGIAMNFLSAGLPVTLAEAEQPALDRGIASIRRNYEASAAKGRITVAQVEAAMALLSPTLDITAFRDCDLLIEAVYENMAVKCDLFAKLDAVAKPGAIIASNTSFLSIDEMAGVTMRPADVLGLHFFSPANVMKLVEVVRGADTAPDALVTAMAVAKMIGKMPVLAGVCHGFIGNRMLRQRQLQAQALTMEGAGPERIDAVHTRFGMPMGPFRMVDLAGVDVGWHRDLTRIESVRDALCAEGRFGQKTKAGYYDYDDKRQATPSPVTAAIIERFRAGSGLPMRSIGDEEIVARTLYVMVNEGARILEEGIAQRASDIDVVWVNGYGWPRATGGPMYWAEQLGLARVVEALDAARDRLGGDFILSPLLVERSRQGGGFAAG